LIKPVVHGVLANYIELTAMMIMDFFTKMPSLPVAVLKLSLILINEKFIRINDGFRTDGFFASQEDDAGRLKCKEMIGIVQIFPFILYY
jgi:hypothetical protein